MERNGSLPFYNYYDQQTIRRIIAELTLANGISTSRIPLLLLSLSIAKDNPYLLAGLVGVVHAMDALDGHVARKGLGNSPLGPHIDIETDHVVEGLILFHYAYNKNYIPKSSFWVLSARNLSTDFLRLYNAFKVGIGTAKANPHQAFGTENRLERLSYGLIKAIGDIAIPIIPKLGLEITASHIGASLARAIPAWTNPISQQLYREFLGAILGRKP